MAEVRRRGDSEMPIEWSVASRPRPGESCSGDRCVVAPFPGGLLLAGIDGLGHGPEAAAAARAAGDALREMPGASLTDLFGRCHERLRRTRGAAMTLVSLEWPSLTMTWAGVGNVDACLLGRGGKSAAVTLQGGVVGYQLPRVRPVSHPLEKGSLLILTTDGISGKYRNGIGVYGSIQEISERVLSGYAKETDDAAVLAARCRGPLT